MSELKITRRGCLAVHLMPKYHGKRLEKAIERIMTNGPKGKLELSAVIMANMDNCPDCPLIPTAKDGAP